MTHAATPATLRPSARPFVRRLVGLALATGLAFGSALGPIGQPAHADDDSYMPTSPSTCQVGLGVTDSGRLRAVVSADTTGNAKMRGEVRVTFTRNGSVTASSVVPYAGRQVVVLGPEVVGKSGRYGATMRFTPSGPDFMRPCSAQKQATYAALDESGTDGPDVTDGPNGPDDGVADDNGTRGEGDQAGDGGLLPGTGGPALWVLGLGAALLALGGALLRRRRA
jgi:hypothetical protein